MDEYLTGSKAGENPKFREKYGFVPVLFRTGTVATLYLNNRITY